MYYELVAMELLCKGFVFSNRMFRTGFVTGYPCDVWCRGCLHPVFWPNFGKSVSNKSVRKLDTMENISFIV